MTDDLFALLFLLPSALGIRATWRLWRIYRYDEDSRDQPILLGLALIATAITVSAIWVGFIALRRLLGFEALEWSPVVSTILAAIILLIPAALERLVEYVARVR